MNIPRRLLIVLGMVAVHVGLLLAGQFALSWPSGGPFGAQVASALFLLGGLQIGLLTTWLVLGQTDSVLRFLTAGPGMLAAWFLSSSMSSLRAAIDFYEIQVAPSIFISTRTFLDIVLFGSLLASLGLLRLWGVRACSGPISSGPAQPTLKFSLRGLLMLIAAVAVILAIPKLPSADMMVREATRPGAYRPAVSKAIGPAPIDVTTHVLGAACVCAALPLLWSGPFVRRLLLFAVFGSTFLVAAYMHSSGFMEWWAVRLLFGHYGLCLTLVSAHFMAFRAMGYRLARGPSPFVRWHYAQRARS